MTLADRVVALHRALAAEGIDHAFGGAIALAYWTEEPRGTRDIDLNIFAPDADPEPALDALPDGLKIPRGTVGKIRRDGQVRLWWDETPVDLFFDNVPIHRDAARNRRMVEFEGIEVPVLGPLELAAFKVMFGRTRDWADIEEMFSAGSLSRDDLKAVIRGLVGPGNERLARIDEAADRA